MPTTHHSPSIRAAERAAGRGGAAAHGPRDATAAHLHLAVDDVSFSHPDRRVLSGVTFAARRGDRIGLVGENGAGKTTLLRIIAGQLAPDQGIVSLPGSVGILNQELPYPDDTPLGAVLDDAQRAPLEALDRLARLGERLAAAADSERAADDYAAALADAERTGAWSAEAERGEMLDGLGLGGIPNDRTIGQISGGQRLRLALAAVLLAAPDTLLLDEPSNHLDDASAAYLERVLAGWPGIVLLASHDRALLDAVATKILDLDPLPVPAEVLADAATASGAAADQGLDPDPGPDPDATDDTGTGLGVRLWGVGYSDARAERAAELARWRDRYAAELERRESLEHEIEVGSREVNRKHESKSESRITRKFYADKDARVTARRARNARGRLDALERERVRRPPEPLRFAGFGAGSAPAASAAADGARGDGDDPIVLAAHEVALPPRLAATTLELTERGRILLQGPNGAGKSTLLAILAGELAQATGEVERFARVGFLPQEVSFPDPEQRADAWYRAAIGADRASARPLTASGLLADRDARRPVGALSIGQQRRLALAALIADPPPVLLLDEPTNHLSLTLVEDLEVALAEYPGALVVASHDRWLRGRWQGQVLSL